MGAYDIDHEALIGRFAEASTKQGEALRKAVHDATLQALQSREMTLTNIKQVLGGVASAASAVAADTHFDPKGIEDLLAKAVGGMDDALKQVVQAYRKALQQMVDQGASLREAQMKQALADVEKLEDALFATLRQAASDAGKSLEGPWGEVLKLFQNKGTGTGLQASTTLAQLMDQAQHNLREGRAAALRTSQALLDSYSALVSGVLIGMSDALQAADKRTPPSSRKK